MRTKTLKIILKPAEDNKKIAFLPRLQLLAITVKKVIVGAFLFYKIREMKKRKEAYKKMLPVYGIISLCYLISYYESDMIEDYHECQIILDALNEYCKENKIKNYPKRYSVQALKWYSRLMQETYGMMIEFNIKEYASHVMKYVEKNS